MGAFVGSSDDTMLLDVAIATWKRDGIERIAHADWPIVAGVRYVISWQLYDGKPLPQAIAQRSDMVVVMCQEVGISPNRNNALRNCQAPIVLISDDDVKFESSQLLSIVSAFNENPDVDVATFMYDGASKRYPKSSVALQRKLPKGYSVSAIEIACRHRVLSQISFDNRFGLGAKHLLCGDDEKFLLDARRKGLNCRFFPIAITSHPHLSTGGTTNPSKGVVAAMGCLMRGEYPYSFTLRLPLKAYRIWRKGGKFWFTLWHLIRGCTYDCSIVSASVFS